MSKKVVIVGGHGNISLRLAKLLSSDYNVISLVRNESHFPDVYATGAKPLLLSLEDDDVNKFASIFEESQLVYYAAGAGGKGGPERTKKVDYEGAVKVFDAIELVSDPKPRLILVSAIDAKGDLNFFPEHYNETDKAASQAVHTHLGDYMHWKYEADKELCSRTAFQYTIIRPAELVDDAATGKAAVGRVHLGKITRDDVAKVLALLAERPDAAGLALDISGGEEDIGQALNAAIKERVTSFLG